MSQRGIKASKEGIAKAEQALTRNSLNKSALARELGLTRQPVSKFFNGKPIERLNFEEICRMLGLEWQEIVDITVNESELVVQQTTTSEDPNFVGREDAIAHLNTLVTSRKAKIIGIYGQGGVGKSTLAQHYFDNQKIEYLVLQVGIDSKYITSIENWLENLLLYNFKIKPADSFIEALEQFKRKLEDKRFGVLIDNLETALDENGKLKTEHRGYVELLFRVLNAPTVNSITLITSREKLNEAKLTFIEHYKLPELNQKAWHLFFSYLFKVNADSATLSCIYQAYGGNALAMKILSNLIQTDYGGDLDAYWQDNNEFLLKAQIKDLISSQFDRLQARNINAYNLLCNLGLYHYQNIYKIPIFKLLCLLGNIPKYERSQVVEILQASHLIELEKTIDQKSCHSDQENLYLNFLPEQGWKFNLKKLDHKNKLVSFKQPNYYIHPFIWTESQIRFRCGKESIDNLLLLIKIEVDNLLASDNQLQSFLKYVYDKQKQLFSNSPYKSACIRCFFIDFLLKNTDLFLSHKIHNTFFNVNERTPMMENFLVVILAIECNLNFDLACAIHQIIFPFNFLKPREPCWELCGIDEFDDTDFVLDMITGINMVINDDLDVKTELRESLQYIKSQVLKYIENIDDLALYRFLISEYKPELIPNDSMIPLVSLKRIKYNCKSSLRTSIEKFERWFQANGRQWIDELQNIISTHISHREISDDWQFTEKQKLKLKRYYDANHLIVDAFRNTSEKVRSYIEVTLFLPIAEIEKHRLND